MSTAQQFVPGWLAHRRVLDPLLEHVSDDQLAFKPWEGAMSLADLVLHIVGSTQWFANALKTGSFSRSEPVTVTSVGELRQVLKESTERTEATLNSLTEPDLERTFERFGDGRSMLSTLKDHEVHHKGQLFVYVRMLGVKELPLFISRG